jgi:hypothetical protein
MTPRPFPRAVATMCFALGLSTAAAAQGPPKEISGRVTDTSGSALAGVTVMADCVPAHHPKCDRVDRAPDRQPTRFCPAACLDDS